MGMSVISYSLGLIVNSAVLLSIIVVYLYYKWRYNYWTRKDIPFPKPIMFFGNIIVNYSLPSMHEILKNVYDEMKSKGCKHCGMYVFNRPVYLVMDPEHIKTILAKDFLRFSDRGLYYNGRDDPISSNLLAVEEEEWRRLRTKLTPSFTASKTKMMFGGLTDCARQMLETLEKIDGKEVDIKEVCACFVTDVIGRCAFGINCNSFDVKDGEFRRYNRKLFEISLPFVLKVMFCSTFKNLAKFLRMRIVDPEIASFLIQLIGSTLKHRSENGVVGKDFLQLLTNSANDRQEKIDVNELAAHAFLFFTAGFDGPSVTMMLSIYELAQNEGIQDKLREEIEEVVSSHDGKLTYEAVLEMKYLHRVVEETMRKHPPVPSIPRICTEPYKLPGGGHYLERDTHVFVPVYAIHRDPEIYPDPERFDPDRFTEENKAKRHNFAYLPFGEGPRMCLGMKFGFLQIKMGLITLLRKYSFSPSERGKYPLEYDKVSIFLAVKDPIWVKATRITN